MVNFFLFSPTHPHSFHILFTSKPSISFGKNARSFREQSIEINPTVGMRQSHVRNASGHGVSGVHWPQLLRIRIISRNAQNAIEVISKWQQNKENDINQRAIEIITLTIIIHTKEA